VSSNGRQHAPGSSHRNRARPGSSLAGKRAVDSDLAAGTPRKIGYMFRSPIRRAINNWRQTSALVRFHGAWHSVNIKTMEKAGNETTLAIWNAIAPSSCAGAATQCAAIGGRCAAMVCVT
jgi:hypothetical protein